MNKLIKINLKELWYLIKSNFKLVIPFLLLFSVVNLVLTDIFITYGLQLAMKLHNIRYLSPDNLVGFYTSFTSLIILFIIFVLLSIVFVFGVSSIMHAYSISLIGKKASFKGMIFAGVKACKKSLLFKNWLIILYVFFIAPLTGVFALCFSSIMIAIPEFISDFILANTLYRTLYYIFYIILLFIESIYLYSINFYILSDSTFIESCNKSRKIIKKNYFINILTIIAVIIITRIAVISLSSVISTLIAKSYQLITGTSESAYLTKIISFIPGLSKFLGAVIEPGINIAIVTVLFFKSIEDNNSIADLSKDVFKDDKHTRRSSLVIGVILIIIFGLFFSTIAIETFNDKEMLQVPDIVAHRGDSVNAPENTAPAFLLAILEKPDWIELDVHQTKDGVIVVSHDDDLSRVTGKNVYVHDLTYDELQELDAGSWFSKDYSYVRISKLEDILTLFSDNIKIQIEVKYTGFDDKLEEHILEVVNKCNKHNQVIYTSLQLEPLKRLKELDPSVITVYSMYGALGHIEDIEYADWFTVEESNITEELVNNVHKANKKIFTWTCNTEERVQYLIDCRVDGILTDDPNMLRNAYLSSSYSGGLVKRIRMFISALSHGL